MMARKVRVEVGSGNIFADLGLPDADTHFLKAQIVSEMYRLTTERKLTQAKAGKLMGITQPEVSRMFKGQFREYSVDRLMGFLTSFDRDVEIVVKPLMGGCARFRWVSPVTLRYRPLCTNREPPVTINTSLKSNSWRRSGVIERGSMH